MGLTELNSSVKALLPAQIYWTGFKLAQISMADEGKVLSQIGWFKGGRYVDYGLPVIEALHANPEHIAGEIMRIFDAASEHAEMEAANG